ncbi:MAG: hypothetical protein NWE77_09185 [Candidatus Bathyarchaeota archaeon]|nr:hypothetical protein [Candidatus Bathyarchaeota archaeon]
MKETEKLRKTSVTLRELAQDWKVNAAIMNDLSRRDQAVLTAIKRLCKDGNRSDLIKIGLTLVAFPLPIVIDDVLGWSLVAAGLIQRKMKNSALYLEDVNKAFPDLVKELQDFRQEMAQFQR